MIYVLSKITTIGVEPHIKILGIYDDKKNAENVAIDDYNEEYERLKHLDGVKFNRIPLIKDLTNGLSNNILEYTQYYVEKSLKYNIDYISDKDIHVTTKSTPTNEPAAESSNETVYGKYMWKMMSPKREDLVPFVIALNDHVAIREYKVVSPSLIYVVFKEHHVFEKNQDVFDFIGKIAEFNNLAQPEYLKRIYAWKKVGDGKKKYDDEFLTEACSGDWIELNKD